jgi:hypothetical protein
MARILLAGAPRSGTTWVGQALGFCRDVRYVDEPDGFRTAFAFRVMLEVGENPRLEPGTAAPDYERLWAGAFAGGQLAPGPVAWAAERAYRHAGTDARRRARAGDGTTPALRIAAALARPPVADRVARDVVVKSVQSSRSVEWVADRFAPRTIVLARHPLNAIASWRDLDFARWPSEKVPLGDDAHARWGVEAPGPDAPLLAQQAFVYAVIAASYTEATRRHPDWITARHEELCVDPERSLEALAVSVGLEWTDAATRFVQDSDRSGTGFDTERLAAEQADRWRDRLSAADLATIEPILAAFPSDLLGAT